MSPTLKRSEVCGRCGKASGEEVVHGLCVCCLAQVAFGGLDGVAVDVFLPPSLAVLGAFGDYELIEEIARGGMGVVFRARQISLGRMVAVKLLRDGFLAEATEVRRFHAEGASAAALRHPHIVGVYEIGEHEGQHYLVMEWVEGRDLSHWIQDGPLPAAKAARWMVEVADAVQHAHDRGVLHRDLKPSNILIDASGEPRITDFGLARRMDMDSTLTRTGQVMGTPGYVAPEQWSGGAMAVTTASDIYGLGAVLYHLLTGRAPFVGDTPAAILRQVEVQDPISPRVLLPSVPRDLETITLKCLAKDPQRRYASARGLGEDLERYLRGEPILARRVGMLERSWRWSRRHPMIAVLGVTVGVLVLVVVGISVAAHFRLAREQQQAEQVKMFLTEILASPDPNRDGREARVIDLLDRARERVRVDVTLGPVVRAEIVSTLGQTYYQLSLYDEAEPLLREALELYAGSLGPRSVPAGAARAHLGSLMVWGRDPADGERELREAVRILRGHRSEGGLALASALGEWGTSLQVVGRSEEALSVLNECVERCRRLGPSADQILASAIGEQATVLGSLGRREESLERNAEAIAINRRLPDGRINLATSLSNHADNLARGDRFEEAKGFIEECLALRKELFGPESSPVAFAHARFAQVLNAAGRWDEALFQSERALELAGRTLPPRHRDLQFHLRQQGTALLRLGRIEEARRVLEEAARVAAENYGDDHSSTRVNRCLLAEALAAAGEGVAARELLEANMVVAEEDARAMPDLASAQRRYRELRELLSRLRREVW